MDSKRKYILHDAEGFENYIEQKYLVHMSDSMATKVFRTFWKFTFYLLDQDCENNRRINFSLLDLLLHKRRVQIEQDISANCNRYQIADSKYTVAYAIYLLSFHPWIYNKLAKENVTLIKSKQSDMPFYKLISWYEHSSKTEHIAHLIEEGFYELPETDGQKEFCEKLFGDSGEKDALLKYYIAALRNAGSFVTATSITDNYILPNLSGMNKERLEDLVNCFDENDQLYWNYYYASYCARVWKYAQKYFDANYITTKYSHFKIPLQLNPALIDE